MLMGTFLWGFNAQAITIQPLKGLDMANDFVVGPGRTVLNINPGETSIKSISLTNRFTEERRFKIEFDDFTSPDNPNDSIKLLNGEKGPYSLKDFISVETTTFVLQPADRADVPVKISIPKNTPPGGLYGAVMITTQSTDPLEVAKENEVGGGISIAGRIASLFYVRVNGDVKEDGSLTDFSTDKMVYNSSPIKFNYVYKNSGSVFEGPSGLIEIKNLYGTTVEQIPISQYFVMPGADRLETKVWDRGFTMGRYTATIKLTRGYGSTIDQKTITFWVMPWKVVAGILIGLFLLLVIIRGIRIWFRKNFEYKGGKNKKAPPA